MTVTLDPSAPRSPSFVNEVRQRAAALSARLADARARGDADVVQHCLDELEELRDTALRGDLQVPLADVPELWAS